MPEEEYVWLPRESLLTFEEIDRLAGIFGGLGVDKLRITGGEPLLRPDVSDLVRMLSRPSGVRDIAMTTNGVLLAKRAAALREAGLTRITLSLDTLRPERFQQFARRNRLADVLGAVDVLRDVGFRGTKINSVITRGGNDDEIIDLFEFASRHGAEIRFIEYMDVGGATGWSPDEVVSRQDIITLMTQTYGGVDPVPDPASPSAPAQRYRVSDGRTFGIIASTTAPFCRTCDRGRLTADGMFFLCLYADEGLDLRAPLRSGASDHEIAELVAAIWRKRVDRGAEVRLSDPGRGALYQISGLRSDPHREMHTRGG